MATKRSTGTTEEEPPLVTGLGGGEELGRRRGTAESGTQAGRGEEEAYGHGLGVGQNLQPPMEPRV